jgi:hypothetical protein
LKAKPQKKQVTLLRLRTVSSHNSSGGKLWRFKYRLMKRKKHCPGAYPTVSLYEQGKNEMKQENA